MTIGGTGGRDAAGIAAGLEIGCEVGGRDIPVLGIDAGNAAGGAVGGRAEAAGGGAGCINTGTGTGIGTGIGIGIACAGGRDIAAGAFVMKGAGGGAHCGGAEAPPRGNPLGAGGIAETNASVGTVSSASSIASMPPS